MDRRAVHGDGCRSAGAGALHDHYNDWTRALGIPPITGSFDFTIEDGQIVAMTNNFNFDDFGPVWTIMGSWTAENGYAHDTLFNPGATNPRLDAESMALWEQITAEFVAEQSGEQ